MKRALAAVTLLFLLAARSVVLGEGLTETCSDSSLSEVTGEKRADSAHDLNDYGILFAAAHSPENECARLAALKLNQKLANTEPESWRTFLSGTSAAYVMATALELEGRRAPLPRDLEARVLSVAHGYEATYSPEDPCGLAGDLWKKGNGCMDDHAIAASGYAWVTAYLRLTGRPWSRARASAMEWLRRSFRTSDSICVHDPERYEAGHSPCNATVAELGTGGIRIISLNHGNQTPAYGLGLMTSIASAFVALEVAEAPLDPAQELTAEERKIIEYLWIEGQEHTDAFGNFHDDSCYYVDTAASTLTKPWGCDDQRFVLAAQPTDAFGVTGYRASWFPLRAFYERHGFGRGNPNLYQFDRSEDTFDKGVWRFFGPGRREIYLTIAGTWVLTNRRPPLSGGNEYPVALRLASSDSGSSVMDHLPQELVTITDLDHGGLHDGDRVTVRRSSGCSVADTGDRSTACTDAGGRAPLTAEVFILEKTAGTGALTGYGDSFSLRSGRDRYLSLLASGELIAVETVAGREETFRFARFEAGRRRSIRH